MVESIIHAILRSLRGEATPAEEEAVRAWRAAAPTNEARFREIEWLLRTARELDEGLAVGPPPRAEDLIRKPIRGYATGLAASPAGSVRPAWRRALLPIAAAAAGVLITLGVHSLWTGEAEPRFVFGVEEFSTAAGEKVTVRLADGSIVRLAPESRLRILGTGREVWLDGQAFFGIAKHEGKPFVVRTRLGEAVVFGTRFDLRVREADMRVVVVEGTVAVSAGGAEVGVGTGQMSIVAEGRRPAVVDVEDVYPLIDWLEGSLVFQSTPLRRAAAEVGRAFGYEVRILDEVLAERTVTAAFTDESFEQVFSILCDVVGAACAIRETTATMALGMESRR